MPVPLGSEVGLTYDSTHQVTEGDYLQTRSGRTYLVLSVRVQERGEYARRRKHIRALVVDPGSVESGAVIHPLTWYRRNA